LDTFIGKHSEADFGTSEVLQNADFAIKTLCDLSDPSNCRTVVVAMTVGKIESHDIHPGLDERCDPIARVGGRSERAYDFGLSSMHGSNDTGVEVVIDSNGRVRWRNLTENWRVRVKPDAVIDR